MADVLAAMAAVFAAIAAVKGDVIENKSDPLRLSLLHSRPSSASASFA
jgi:hypothetical protein